MAAVDVTARPGELQSEQYDQAEADFWRDLVIPGPQDPAQNGQQPTLDMDEEIKITKKRKPVAKLDAERLLSERGIPELRRRAAKRLKYRGKGHEFEDMGSLLQMYQMWLDDMFPKAKFRDGLAMVEKVGHTKRLNVMRREWIASTRPIVRDAEPESDHEFQPEKDGEAPEQVNADLEVPQDDFDALLDNEPNQQQEPGEDELDALLATETTPPKRKRTMFEDDEDEDELDALLNAETNTKKTAPANDFADDEDAMNEMGIW